MMLSSPKIPYFRILVRAGRVAIGNRALWPFGFLFVVGRGATIATLLEFLGVLLALTRPLANTLLIGFAVLVVSALLKAFSFGWIARSVSKKKEIKGWIAALYKNGVLMAVFAFLVGGLVTLLFLPVFFARYVGFTGASIGLGAVAVLIFFPLLVLIMLTRRYALLYETLGNVSIANALGLGYNLLRTHWKQGLIMLLLLGVAALVVAFFSIFVLTGTGAAFLLPALAAYALFGYSGMMAVGVIVGLIGLLFLAWLIAIWGAFTQTAWTLFFEEIAKEPTAPILATESASVPIGEEALDVRGV